MVKLQGHEDADSPTGPVRDFMRDDEARAKRSRGHSDRGV